MLFITSFVYSFSITLIRYSFWLLLDKPIRPRRSYIPTWHYLGSQQIPMTLTSLVKIPLLGFMINCVSRFVSISSDKRESLSIACSPPTPQSQSLTLVNPFTMGFTHLHDNPPGMCLLILTRLARVGKQLFWTSCLISDTCHHRLYSSVILYALNAQ